MGKRMRVKAVIEVTAVFCLTLLLVVLASLSPAGRWERQATSRPYLEYTVMIAVPLLLLALGRRNLAAHGLSLRPLRYHLDVAATAFIPVALAGVVIGFVDYRSGSGALLLAAAKIAVLLTLGPLLRRKPTRKEDGLVFGALLLAAFFPVAPKFSFGNASSVFVFYVLFLGLGEELLFRGYIQSRLNAAFGRPFRFFGVPWGWGVVIASALFALMHVLNLGSLVGGAWRPAPWWGVWTFFGGLVLGYVREKTGSIAAPALLHGLPQAIAAAFLGR